MSERLNIPIRTILILAVAAVCLTAALSVVLPKDGRTVVTVARFGSAVRLLPPGFGFSFWPLTSRISVPVEEGRAVVSGRFAVPTTNGSSLPVSADLRLIGSGRLPFAAADVRRIGLAEAAGAWLAEALPSSGNAAELLAEDELWKEIFGEGPVADRSHLKDEVAHLFDEVELVDLVLQPKAKKETVREAARRELGNRTHSSGRLVVLGLDALDWQLADVLMRRGLMPNLRHLVANGAHAVLGVPPPLISPVVWTTIATGVPPEVHGILDFLESDPDGGVPHPVSSASCKAPRVWEMTAAAGRSASVIGWWATFPAVAPQGGTVYSDRLTEQLLGLEATSPGVADPPEAATAVRDLVVRGSDVTPAMVAEFVAIRDSELDPLRSGESGWDDPVGGLAKLVAATITVERLTQRELDRGTEVIFSYLEGTDTVGHLFAPYRPPALPGTDPGLARRFGGVVDRYYAHVDRWLGRIVEQLDPRDTLVLVSDHGFHWFDERPRIAAGAHTPTAVWWHRTEGAFVAYGPEILHTPVRQRLGLMDVTPVVLELAGLPPAAEMPGTIPEWLLPPQARAADGDRPTVRYAALLPVAERPTVELSPEAREEELAKLRALGYVAPSDPQNAGPAQPPRPNFDRAEARRLNNLGTSRSSAGDKAGAAEAFRQAIAADPTYAAAHYNLGLAYRNQGRMEESDREIWRAIELGVGDREMAVVRMALDYRQRGEFDTAREVFARGRAMFPDSEKIWLNSGVFLGERGDFAGSKECLERAVQLAPNNPNAHANLAAAYLALGDMSQGRRALTRAAELAPENAKIQQDLAALGGPLK
jgi:Flp pilus assembly protein TadD